MRITVLIENNAPAGLLAEWGLSLWIEHLGRRYLLDAGESSRFAENCAKLGVDLSEAGAAILSHAHYDHANGLASFCAANRVAPVYIRRAVGEDCYSWHGAEPKYIGVRRGLLAELEDRLVRVDGVAQVGEGAYLLPHSRADMAARGARAGMFVRRADRFVADDFAHEQSLVLVGPEGLVICSSCTHGGVDALLDEAASAFPDRPVRAIAGGLHLFRSPPEEVRALAGRLKEMGAPELYAGHCTGDEALKILGECLPGRVHRLETGMTVAL